MSMKAAVLHGQRDMRIEDRNEPVLERGMVLIRNRRVGVCGSDLHYFQHGYCAGFVPDRPFVLGHELAADVVAVGDGVDTVQVGERVTVNPARSCGFCTFCKAGRPNLCERIIMLGSASTKPPTDGALAEFTSVRADQCFVLPMGFDAGLAALMEPLAVALHAAKRGGAIAGKRVLVLGGGTIGLLAAVVARAFGATLVVVSDIVPERRTKALELVADEALDPTMSTTTQRATEMSHGGFDCIFEASGSPMALRQGFSLVRSGGTIVQIGTVGNEDVPIPANLLMNREINYVGSMRYSDVFSEGIALVHAGRINLRPFITHVLPLESSAKAMEIAGERINSLKVQIEIP